MDLDEARAFIGEHHSAVLGTRGKNGRIQLTPIAVAVDAEGRLIISSVATTVKVRNLRREPYASLLVLSDGIRGRWVQVEGPAEVVDQPEAVELLVDYYQRVAGEHPDWDEYRQAMVRDGRVLVRVTPERAGPG